MYEVAYLLNVGWNAWNVASISPLFPSTASLSIPSIQLVYLASESGFHLRQARITKFCHDHHALSHHARVYTSEGFHSPGVHNVHVCVGWLLE